MGFLSLNRSLFSEYTVCAGSAVECNSELCSVPWPARYSDVAVESENRT